MKTSKERGAAEKIYFDAEAIALLNTAVVETGLVKSNIVCALIRALLGYPARAGEERVFAKLKKVFGRDQFIAFLRAVAEVLPPEAKPIVKPGHANDDFKPDSWILGKLGILAFFNPNGDNVGQVFSAASKLKGEHTLQRVIVVSPLADTMPQPARDDMKAAGIEVVSISSLAKELKKLSGKPKGGRQIIAKNYTEVANAEVHNH